MNLLILDSGHDEKVAGKRNEKENFYEWKFNDSMQYKIKKRAEEHGITVYLTNPNPKGIDEIGLSKRCTLANNYWTNKSKPKSLFISLHANAFSDPSARGTETYVHNINASQNSKNAARYVQDELMKCMKSLDSSAKDRGVKSYNYAVLRETSMPSILIEYAFYSNLADLKILKNNEDELVEATVKAICKYFNISYKSPIVVNPVENTETEIWYRAVCGSFKTKAAAEARIKELSSKGFDGCFITTFEKKI